MNTSGLYNPSGLDRVSSVTSKDHAVYVVNRYSRPSAALTNRNITGQTLYKTIASTGGLTALVSGVSDAQLEVLSYNVSSSGVNAVSFLSGTGTLLETTYLAVNSSADGGPFKAAIADSLYVSSSGPVAGSIAYRLV